MTFAYQTFEKEAKYLLTTNKYIVIEPKVSFLEKTGSNLHFRKI